MEEKKTVKMNAEKVNDNKLSYEDLEKFAYQLSAQAKNLESENKALKNAINGMRDVITRMKFLLEVVKNSNVKFNEEFATKCAEEFEDLMTIPEQSEEDKNQEQNESK